MFYDNSAIGFIMQEKFRITEILGCFFFFLIQTLDSENKIFSNILKFISVYKNSSCREI